MTIHTPIERFFCFENEFLEIMDEKGLNISEWVTWK
jgi:hypothetical protein